MREMKGSPLMICLHGPGAWWYNTDWWKPNVYLQNMMLFCLFELMLKVPVNSYGHVGTLRPFYGTFTQH